MLGKLNLKVFIFDADIYGRYAINSYLAWDRRTRVVGMAESVDEMFDWLTDHAEAEWPNIIILDTYTFETPDSTALLVQRLQRMIHDVFIVVLDRHVAPEAACVALKAGARGYFVRNDVGLQIAWALVWAQDYPFSVTRSMVDYLHDDLCLQEAAVIPDKREYPELTDRIREAIQLCVVEGMSADLAADEMGVSTHTIRSYVKEGYRILESYDTDMEYPPEMSAQERAFMRYTAIEGEPPPDELRPELLDEPEEDEN
jgi:DNA-binding NarL/FixJ family response regulator